MFRRFLIIMITFTWLFPIVSYSQEKPYWSSTNEQIANEAVYLLPELIIYPNKTSQIKKHKVPRRYRKNSRAYNRTIRNLKIVYPLAKQASKELNKINSELQNIPTEKERKEYIKQEYKALMSIYKEPMKKLKISQGRMLLLLIDRETGNTTYSHLKDFKGGFTAFFWQGIAKLFGNDLKATYNPYDKDFYLEQLIQQYERGEL